MREHALVEIALVVYTGVLAEECSAFRSVLERIAGARVVNVASRHGSVHGPGGSHTVEATFDDIPQPDVVLVPGGLGCGRLAEDPELRTWLQRVAPRCRWMVASSTGSVALAAAGLLQGTPAATHWLAADLLRDYGVVHSSRRLEIGTNRITCEGRVTAVAAAYAVVEGCAGHHAAADIRRQLDGTRRAPVRPTPTAPVRARQTGETVLVELEILDPSRSRSRR
jgi:transcriptional regulator GlxA family with amidase domain